MANFRIRPISTGRFMELEKSNFTYGVDQGLKIQSAVYMWFIEGAEKKILVDAGVSDPAWAAQYHHPLERAPNEDPVKGVEDLGVKATDIDIVVNTHLHWDHCFNNHLFPNAKILVQAEELRYAIAPLPCHGIYYESQVINMAPQWLKVLDRIETVKGEVELESGIRLVPLPGHTPGFQGVLIDLESGPCLIAGDSVPLFENWEGNAQVAHIPPGIHVNLWDCYDSFKKMETMARTVLPGHDLKVLEREIYE
ncbi:MAG: N-acyl homoserine lactonase family protein [Desulfobacteraceae bacterium]|nr:N-acyl homoserine lactonase family protein [Desulfobacteraceae bacterium]